MSLRLGMKSLVNESNPLQVRDRYAHLYTLITITTNEAHLYSVQPLTLIHSLLLPSPSSLSFSPPHPLSLSVPFIFFFIFSLIISLFNFILIFSLIIPSSFSPIPSFSLSSTSTTLSYAIFLSYSIFIPFILLSISPSSFPLLHVYKPPFLTSFSPSLSSLILTHFFYFSEIHKRASLNKGSLPLSLFSSINCGSSVAPLLKNDWQTVKYYFDGGRMSE